MREGRPIPNGPIKAKPLGQIPKGPPELKVDGSKPLPDQMAATLAWLSARIAWGQNAGEDAKTLASLMAQFTSASRHLAKLTGALEVSEGQIVKSPKWRVLMGIVWDAVGEDPKVIRKINAGIDSYLKGERK